MKRTKPESGPFVENLVALLEHYGPVAFEQRKDGRVRVPEADETGFEVWAGTEDTHFTVGYGSWHEYFEAEEEAVNCFMSGVFGESRLAMEKRGGFTQSWTAEALIEGKWVPISKTALFVFPFWRKRIIQYLRNDRKPRERGD